MDFPKTLSQFYKSIIRKFPFYFISIFIINVIIYVIDFGLFPYANKWAVAVFEYAGVGNFNSAMKLITLLIVYYSSLWVIGLVNDIIEGRLHPKVMRYTNFKMFQRVYENDTNFFISRPAGQIASKVGEVENNLIPLLLDFWSNVVAITITFALLSSTFISMNIWLSVFVIGCGFVRAIWQFAWQKPINKASKEIVDVTSDISGVRTDSLGNALMTKLFASTKFENDYIYKKQDREVTLKQKRAFLRRIQFKPASFVFLLMQAGIVIICWYLISRGQIGISDAVFAFMGGRAIAGAFAQLAKELQNYSENKSKAKHAYADLIQPVEIVDKPNAKNLIVKNAEIDFDHVSFDYGNKSVIKNFDLHIDEHQKVGVVGLSGAGKTTLVNLILRLYDVKSGSIKIDGQDIRDVKQDSLRRQIAFVPQESVLFNRSLLENIRYARPSATKAEVIAAAKKANIHDFIESQPDKYETLVGNRGIKLSGGQRQRIAIARAILKNAPILILDEATSALDSKNEKLIQDALNKIMRGKTSIVIAHRLSTLRNMDRIIVMERGKIVESGTHTQLLRKGGLYKKLWGMQTNGFIAE